MKSALVLGGEGLIGGFLAQDLRSIGWHVDVTTRNSRNAGGIFLDILNPQGFSAIPQREHGVAIMCIGYAPASESTLEASRSYEINVLARQELAQYLVNAGFRLILFSSDAVFSGDSVVKNLTSEPDARSIYGRHMKEFESIAVDLGPKVSVIRLGKVFHANLQILHRWISSLLALEKIFAPVDLKTAPISLGFLSAAVRKVISHDINGIIHASYPRGIAWSEIARCLARSMGIEDSSVVEVNSSDLSPPIPPRLHPGLFDTHYFDPALARGFPAVQGAVDSAIRGITEFEHRNLDRRR